MRSSPFIKNIMLMISGGAAGSLFSLAIAPIISRLYDPADFGVAALFLSIAALIGNLAPLTYERAIVISKTQDEANSLLNAALFCMLTVLICATLILVTNSMHSFLPYQDKLGAWLYLVPVMALIVGSGVILEMWTVRYKHFRNLAMANMVDPISLGSTRLALGYFLGSAVWPLISGLFIGALFKIGILASLSLSTLKTAFRSFNARSLKKTLREYKDFPIFNAPASFINRLASELPMLIFGALYAPEIVGFYAIAIRLLQAPVTVCSNTARKVYHQRLAEQKNNGKRLTKSYIQFLAFCFVVGLVPFGALYLFGEEFITLLLGEKWRTAGVYSEILIPWLFSLWLTIPSSVVVEVLRKQNIWLYVQVFHLSSRSLVFFLGSLYALSIEEMLHYFVLVCLAGSLLVMTVCFVISYRYDKGLSDANSPSP